MFTNTSSTNRNQLFLFFLGTFVIAVALYFTAEKGVQFYKKESLVLLYGAETNVPLLTGADFDYSNPMTDSTKKKKKRGSEASSGSGSTGLDDTFEESNPMFENDDNTSSTSTSTFTSPQKRGSVRMIGSPESQKSKKNIEEYGIYTQNINKNDGNDDDKDKDIEKDGDKNKDTDKEKDNNKKDSSNNRYDRSPNPPVISTENRYTEIDEKPFIKQPYAIIVSVLVVWAMYATLYIAQELTSKCSWGYFVLLTMYVLMNVFVHLTE